MKVLIAEDDATTSLAMATILTRWGYQVVTASTGIQALPILQADDGPRLVLLDWMMPGMDGIELCREVRKWSGRTYIYILILTAKNRKSDLLKALDAGADEFLTKPIDEFELKARLEIGRRIVDLQEKLLSAATHDPLTGLWNHGAICEHLARELDRTGRHSSSLGVILGDLDNFKRINDTYGHLAGDAVLREVGQRMKHTLRSYDGIGRYGGEEFLIVAPDCGAICIRELAERVRHAVVGHEVVLPEGRIPVTISLGAAACPPGQPMDVDKILRAADHALYRAKDSGRNRVEFE